MTSSNSIPKPEKTPPPLDKERQAERDALDFDEIDLMPLCDEPVREIEHQS